MTPPIRWYGILTKYWPKAQRSVATCYENSFGVTAAKLWNLLPAKVNCLTALEPFKIALAEFLESFTDKPPLDGYTAATNNSLLEWSLQKDRYQVMVDVQDTVDQKWSLPNLPKVSTFQCIFYWEVHWNSTCLPTISEIDLRNLLKFPGLFQWFNRTHDTTFHRNRESFHFSSLIKNLEILLFLTMPWESTKIPRHVATNLYRCRF